MLRMSTPKDAGDRALLDEWVLRQRAAGLSEKTIRERIGIICRLPNAATLTAVDVDRFLANPAWARSTRATYHGAIRAWSLWLVRTGRRPDDPPLIATAPKVPKGRPRPVADEDLVVLRHPDGPPDQGDDSARRLRGLSGQRDRCDPRGARRLDHAHHRDYRQG